VPHPNTDRRADSRRSSPRSPCDRQRARATPPRDPAKTRRRAPILSLHAMRWAAVAIVVVLVVASIM
jgi:hypothetical protein